MVTISQIAREEGATQQEPVKQSTADKMEYWREIRQKFKDCPKGLSIEMIPLIGRLMLEAEWSTNPLIRRFSSLATRGMAPWVLECCMQVALLVSKSAYERHARDLRPIHVFVLARYGELARLAYWAKRIEKECFDEGRLALAIRDAQDGVLPQTKRQTRSTRNVELIERLNKVREALWKLEEAGIYMTADGVPTLISLTPPESVDETLCDELIEIDARLQEMVLRATDGRQTLHAIFPWVERILALRAAGTAPAVESGEAASASSPRPQSQSVVATTEQVRGPDASTSPCRDPHNSVAKRGD
jgi:hypothetical protein